MSALVIAAKCIAALALYAVLVAGACRFLSLIDGGRDAPSHTGDDHE